MSSDEQIDPVDPAERAERLRARVRQLILMRETGPKRAGWHAARMRLIWRLHDELRAAGEQGAAAGRQPADRHDQGSGA